MASPSLTKGEIRWSLVKFVRHYNDETIGNVSNQIFFEASTTVWCYTLSPPIHQKGEGLVVGRVDYRLATSAESAMS